MGTIEIARLFIKYGADVEAANHHFWRPMHYAEYYQKSELVALLRENGADVEATTAQLRTPLLVSFTSEDVPLSIIQSLVTAGANLEARDASGCTPLGLALLEAEETSYHTC